MRKVQSIILVVLIVFALSCVTTFAQRQIGIYLDSEPITFSQDSGYPFIDDNSRTLVPLRITMESAGYLVRWDEQSRTATVSDGLGTQVHVRIGDTYITKEITRNGQTETTKIQNDTYARIQNNRTFLPIRVVLEAFGATVSWDAVNKNVHIVASKNQWSIVSQADVVMSPEEIYASYSPSVFYIELYDAHGDFFGSGSGFFTSRDGEAITNYHVIENASYASVFTHNGQSYNVEGVLDYNKDLDIAKLKIEGSGFSYIPIPAEPRVIGGSPAYAIGSPLGLRSTISEGIISNPDRVLDGKTYYQVSTPISSGSSGGPLFNKYGEVIGITTAMFTRGQNLNLAVPIGQTNKLTGTVVKALTSLFKNSSSYKDDSQYYGVPFYPNYYPAPDFGEIFGVPIYDYYESKLGMSAYYRMLDMISYFSDASYLDIYVDFIEGSGFYYSGSHLNEYNNTVLRYTNYKYGMTLLFSVSEHYYGGSCFLVMVLWD